MRIVFVMLYIHHPSFFIVLIGLSSYYRHHFEENCLVKSQISKLYQIYVCTLPVVTFKQNHEQKCYLDSSDKSSDLIQNLPKVSIRT